MPSSYRPSSQGDDLKKADVEYEDDYYSSSQSARRGYTPSSSFGSPPAWGPNEYLRHYDDHDWESDGCPNSAQMPRSNRD